MNKSIESLVRILLHGIFLVSLNLFSVMAAIVVMKLGSLGEDKIMQSGIALGVNVIVYLLVYKIMFAFNREIMRVDNFSALTTILLISMALLPVIFFPMHFLTHGKWGAVDSLTAVWPFQFIVNGLCLVLNFFIFSKRNS